MTDVTPVEEVVAERVDEGDHDRFAMWCNRRRRDGGHDHRRALPALLGKRWVPSRDPKRYPVCPTCKEIVERAGFNLPSG